eukprot:TRINITY_DN12473_c0_g2_i3.p1 TRINITY_DN12473_c0_g2~~TRINITY_DN12473_c0_g2_i3.p1  ORF type:complete len:497 (+),score=143.63 TRINITY_DN12473_c0_g2_i3:320-1810(+)
MAAANREREKEREREAEKAAARERERVREIKERDRERDSERERERDRERKRERYREEREKEKERERRRERERIKEKEREKREISEREEEEERDRERKRRKKEGKEEPRKDEAKKADCKTKKGEDGGSDYEQRKLDEQMETRRRRVLEWQELQKRKLEEAKPAENGEVKVKTEENEDVEVTEDSVAKGKAKEWTLDGDDSDEEAEKGAANGLGTDREELVGAPKMRVKTEDAADAEAEGAGPLEATAAPDEDIDPLDAFMNAMVLPKVKGQAVSASAPPVKEEPEDDNDDNFFKPAGKLGGQKGKPVVQVITQPGKPGSTKLEQLSSKTIAIGGKKVGSLSFSISLAGPGKNGIKGGGANGIGTSVAAIGKKKGEKKTDRKLGPMNSLFGDEDSGGESEEADDEGNPGGEPEEDDKAFISRLSEKSSKVDKLALVDHTKMDYPPFRKFIYIEVKDISRMTVEEVTEYRKEFEFKLRGKEIPKPIRTWNQMQQDPGNY